MAKLIRCLPGGIKEEYIIYDSPSENSVAININGTNKYLGLTTEDTGRKLKLVKKVNNVLTEFYIQSARLFTVTINQKNNQTIHVYTPSKSDTNAVDHTETFTAEYGTTYELDVTTNEGYIAGELSVNES